MPTSTPELTPKKKTPAPAGSKRFTLSTRPGTFALAAVAALGALGVLLVFMSNYRDSVRSGADQVRVLVANRAIDQGTQTTLPGTYPEVIPSDTALTPCKSKHLRCRLAPFAPQSLKKS